VSCALDSEQERWLIADLAMHPTRCTLAYWHHPRFTSGAHGPYRGVDPLIRRLYEAGVDVVLNGHEHHYERFAPQSPEGSADATRGIRFFVVGTGGIPLRYFPTVAANSEVRSVEAHGVLRMVLHPSSYEWRFIPVEGRAFSDSGVASCH
jgi:hypothetical protein